MHGDANSLQLEFRLRWFDRHPWITVVFTLHVVIIDKGLWLVLEHLYTTSPKVRSRSRVYPPSHSYSPSSSTIITYTILPGA